MPIGSVVTLALIASLLNGNPVDRQRAADRAAHLQLVEFHMTRQEEDESTQFCMKAGLGNEDFCSCWTGGIENDFSRDEYRAYRTSIINKTPLTGDLKTKVDDLLEETRSLTSGAR